jgi:hypothetical protein
MIAPDDTAKPRIVVIIDQHNTKLYPLVQHLATRGFTQFAT